jgi:Cdc6-like AAA superfamily ATPase
LRAQRCSQKAGSRSSNLILQGVTGSGKTSTLQYVLKKYDSKLYTFVSCKQQKGVKEVLAQLGNVNALARQRAPEILPKVIENLKKERRLIILDDVTQVSSWLELMNYLDGIYRAVQTPIFVTTNVFQFLDRLPQDVRHTLLFFRVEFGAYNAKELHAILKDRVDLSGAGVPEATLGLIAALSADIGSARDALMMTRTAVQSGKSTENEIRELKRMMEEQTYMDYLNKLAPKERQVLDFIVQEYGRTKQPIPVRDVSRALKLSPSRTSQLITGLEQYEIISTQVNRKRGNFREIEPDSELVEKMAKKQAVLASES